MSVRTPKWARNPRRSYDANGREITPGTIGDMIGRDGVRHVWARCRRIGCGHEALVCVDGWPPEMFVPDIDLRLRCSRCGTRHHAGIVPDWRERDGETARRERGERGLAPDPKACASPNGRSQPAWWK